MLGNPGGESIAVGERLAVVAANGFNYNVVGALVDYLLCLGYEVEYWAFPLEATEPSEVRVRRAGKGQDFLQTSHRSVKVPVSYLLDPLQLKVSAPFDVAFSFNPALTMRLLGTRRRRREAPVVHWTLDFSPRRFRSISLEWLYREAERNVLKHASHHVDISQVARSARYGRCGLPIPETCHVVPVGFWKSQVSVDVKSQMRKPRVAFVGSMNPRQGGLDYIAALQVIIQSEPDVEGVAIGDGEERKKMQALAKSLGLSSRIRFTGHLDEAGIAKELAECSVGMAPYKEDKESLSYFCDPSKVRQYLRCGVPVVMTRVPPIWAEIDETAGLAVPSNPDLLAEAALTILRQPERREKYVQGAASMALANTWESSFSRLFASIGIGGDRDV